MSDDVPARITAAFGSADPWPDATERARRAALEAVTARRPRTTRLRAAVMGLCAAVVATGAALAAAGETDPPGTPHHPTRTAAPAARDVGARLVGGRAWISDGAGIDWSRPARAVDVSPARLFIAIGNETSLIAVEAAGDERWRHPTTGPVVAIDWAPYPTYIAYVVGRGRTHDLHVIWANGTHDRRVVRDVAPQPVRWRSDTGAVSFVRADGTGAVWNRITGVTASVPARPGAAGCPRRCRPR